MFAVESKPVWDSYGTAPGVEKPPPRTGHVLLATGGCIILFVHLSPSSPLFVKTFCRFGGTDGRCHHNDTWLFDVLTRKWAELQCTGYIPPPREGHAAALVDDVMYVFGGRGVDGADLDELIAFKLSSK